MWWHPKASTSLTAESPSFNGVWDALYNSSGVRATGEEKERQGGEQIDEGYNGEDGGKLPTFSRVEWK